MRHRDYVAEREARDPAFKAAREASRPQREWQRALIRARIEAGLTQQELAERIGTQQSAIARWESGRVSPSVSALAQIASATGTTFLVAGTPEPVVACALAPTLDLWSAQLQHQMTTAQEMLTLITQLQDAPATERARRVRDFTETMDRHGRRESAEAETAPTGK